jgi:hypothetical protein
MNYSGDWRYVSGEWGDGWKPYEEELGPTLDGKKKLWWGWSEWDGWKPYEEELETTLDGKKKKLWWGWSEWGDG